MIRFYLNGQLHELTTLNPNTTILGYLREHVRLTDTKEGCGSGDCGACTVMVQRLPLTLVQAADKSDYPAPFYTLNSCITLLSLIDGHHVMTASYLADNPEHHPERALLHPTQQAMVDCHGSQCGFCTPGFVMSLACVYENKRLARPMSDQPNNKTLSPEIADEITYDEVVAAISGNLCRCTGYRPIIAAGLSMRNLGDGQNKVKELSLNLATDAMADGALPSMTHLTSQPQISQYQATEPQNLPAQARRKAIAPAISDGTRQLFMPQTTDELNQLLSIYPKATLWAGGTDLGLSITQHLMDHETIIQLSAIDELKSWSLQPIEKSDSTSSIIAKELVLGAGMSYQQMLPVLEEYFPTFAQIFERIASPQIRNMGTLGGNIANASPIGDLPPILLALDAKIHLRHCHPDKDDAINDSMPLADFFMDYKKTKLSQGSYIVAIHIPLMTPNQHLYIHKISKRYEDDISACLLAMRVDLAKDHQQIMDARVGLGGMAAVPKLAINCQQAFIGQPVVLSSFEQAAKALIQDVSPMTDVRASREYRLHVTERLIVKCAKQLIKELSSKQSEA